MKQMTRWIIAVALVLAVVVIAGNNIAWADTVDQGFSGLVQGQGDAAPSSVAGIKKGTVVPPDVSKECLSPVEVHSLYGIALLGLPEEPVEDPDIDAPNYCVEAVIWNRRFPPGRLPEEVDSLLTNLLVLRVYIYGEIVDKVPHGQVSDEVPEDVGEISLCFSKLPGEHDEQIYFFDFFGPRFSRPNPDWSSSVTIEPIQIEEYLSLRSRDLQDYVCTQVLASGAYVLADTK